MDRLGASACGRGASGELQRVSWQLSGNVTLRPCACGLCCVLGAGRPVHLVVASATLKKTCYQLPTVGRTKPPLPRHTFHIHIWTNWSLASALAQ